MTDAAEIVEVSSLTAPATIQPRVVVYSSNEAVPSQKFVAYVTVPTKAPKGGGVVERRLGISFPAADDETARTAAHRWWQAQLDREAAREAEAEERGRRLAASREAKASPTIPAVNCAKETE